MCLGLLASLIDSISNFLRKASESWNRDKWTSSFLQDPQMRHFHTH